MVEGEACKLRAWVIEKQQEVMSGLAYKPRFLEINNKLSISSDMYLFLTPTVFQRPCFCIRRSLTPMFAAADAPPDLRLCKPYNSESNPILFNVDTK